MDSQHLLSAWLIWFVAGIGLAFLELQLPGFIVLFFGIGCWVVAAALLVWDLTAARQFMLFSISSIVSIILLRRWFMRIFRGSSDQAARDFDDFPKGEHVSVLKRISPQESGRVKFRGTAWDAVADPETETIIEAGETVEIVCFADDSHTVFMVKKIETNPNRSPK